MPTFTLQMIDADEELFESKVDFPDLESAKVGAQAALKNLAASGLPATCPGMLSVELFDEDKTPIVEYRLMFEEIVKVH